MLRERYYAILKPITYRIFPSAPTPSPVDRKLPSPNSLLSPRPQTPGAITWEPKSHPRKQSRNEEQTFTSFPIPPNPLPQSQHQLCRRSFALASSHFLPHSRGIRRSSYNTSSPPALRQPCISSQYLETYFPWKHQWPRLSKSRKNCLSGNTQPQDSPQESKRVTNTKEESSHSTNVTPGTSTRNYNLPKRRCLDPTVKTATPMGLS